MANVGAVHICLQLGKGVCSLAAELPIRLTSMAWPTFESSCLFPETMYDDQGQGTNVEPEAGLCTCMDIHGYGAACPLASVTRAVFFYVGRSVREAALEPTGVAM